MQERKRDRGRAILIIEKSPKNVKHKSLETGSNALLLPVSFGGTLFQQVVGIPMGTN